MTTAIDSNVIIDLLTPRSPWFETASGALAEALRDGEVVVCEAAVAEVVSHFPPDGDPSGYLAQMGLALTPTSPNALLRAGTEWVKYSRSRPAGIVCPACGAETQARCSRCEAPIAIRQRVLADFLVGAHALEHADRLLTRDPTIYRRYFPELDLV